MPPAKIWVVDDDQDDLDTLQDLFEQAGLDQQVSFFQHSSQVLEHLCSKNKEALPALILSDLNMPVLSGLDLVQAVQKMNLLSQLDIIILTTSSSPSDKARCLMAGAKDYLIKPLRVQEYQELISSLKIYL